MLLRSGKDNKNNGTISYHPYNPALRGLMKSVKNYSRYRKNEWSSRLKSLIKYIAELIYGESEKEVLEKAVRFVIILLVLVFDPLAILLVVSANMTYMQRKGELITAVDIDDTVVEEKIIPEEPADGVVGGLGDEPEVSPPSAADDAADVRVANATDFGIDDTQLRKLDRSTRNKLQWLIDKVDIKGD